MRRWKLALIFCILFCPTCALRSEAVKGGEALDHPAVRVLLKEVDGVLLEARGPFEVINLKKGRRIGAGSRGKFAYLSSQKSGIKWGTLFSGVAQLRIAPTSPSTTFLVDGIQYRGAIEAHYFGEKLSLVNEVDVEDFLKATLPKRVSPHLPAVLDSIAIVARTHIYYSIQLNQSALWHVLGEGHRYRGMGLAMQNPAVDRSIDNTRYLIMTFERSAFPASWHEHCGGRTGNYRALFRRVVKAPPGIESPDALRNRRQSHWTFSINNRALAKLAQLNRVTKVDRFVDPASKKVYAIRLHDGVHVKTMDFPTFQRQLGEDKIRSNDFAVDIRENIVTFEGHGRGMGVGLCLYSATHLSERGEDVPHVLATFFPHTRLQHINTLLDLSPLREG